MELHELTYSSTATRDMSLADLTALLEKSRCWNAQRGITGMLIYHQRKFMQLLEGDKKAIFSLYGAICVDPRNRDNYPLWDGPIAQRSFSKWSMAFVAPDESALKDRLGYSDFLEIGSTAQMRSERVSVGKSFLYSLRDDFLKQLDNSQEMSALSLGIL